MSKQCAIVDSSHGRTYHDLMRRKAKQGLSLLETTVAVYVMAAALLVVIGLFHSGMKARSETLQRKRATQALRGAHTQLLTYSNRALGTEYGFDHIRDNWRTRVEPVVVDPQFQASFEVSREPALATSTSFEQRFAAPQRLQLGERLRVDITVTGLDQTARSVCWLSDPPRRLHAVNPLRITQVSLPSPLPAYSPPASTVEGLFEGVLYDQYDHRIESATFTWNVIPIDGNATLLWDQDLGDRSGRTARLRNWVSNQMGDPTIQPGSVLVECQTVYRGREITETIGPLRLAP